MSESESIKSESIVVVLTLAEATALLVAVDMADPGASDWDKDCAAALRRADANIRAALAAAGTP